MKDELKITDYGARNGELCTAAIQRAIDECSEGGYVVIPKGTYISGAIFLKSDMTLYFESGARLVGSTNTADYPLMKYRWEGNEHTCYASLINMPDGEHKNVTICGDGTIDASGVELRKGELSEDKGKPGRAVCIRNTDGVRLEGITIRQSPAWCLHILYCTNVDIECIEIHTRYDENGVEYENIVNGDGIDIDSCTNVNITDCLIESEDDCIAIKSGRDEEGRKVGAATENVVIDGCRFRNGFGVAMGSEMSGNIRNVTVKNCEYRDSFCAVSVKTKRGRGGKVEDIHFENCSLVNADKRFKDCKWFRGCIYIDSFYSEDEFDINTLKPVSDETPFIENIYMKNIELETVGGRAIYICGLPEAHINNVFMENIKAEGIAGMFVANTDNMEIKNTCVTVGSREE